MSEWIDWAGSACTNSSIALARLFINKIVYHYNIVEGLTAP